MRVLLVALAVYCVIQCLWLFPVTRRECMDCRAPYRALSAVVSLLVALVLSLVFIAQAHAQTVRVPDVNAHLRLLVEQTAADEWGVDSSPARLAAQLHQESRWDAHAKSGAGAEGLAQIMPATGRWLAKKFPELGAWDPWDPAWSIRAAAVYDHWLLTRNPGAGACSSWAFALSAYNGGETMLHREQSLSHMHGHAADRWFHNVADYRVRSLPAWRENRAYVQRILCVLEPAYIDAGWSGQAVCT